MLRRRQSIGLGSPRWRPTTLAFLQTERGSTTAGDAAFAAAAASAIFGSAATANTSGAIQGFVSNWEAFYSSHGIPGVANPTANQIDLAARGAAWGDAVGVALANNLGPLIGLAINFLEDAAQGTATYSASLSSHPTARHFKGQQLRRSPPRPATSN
jgi:hypothetical protein